MNPLSSKDPIVVLGLGVAGRAAAKALTQRGYSVIAFEDSPTDENRSFADEHGIEFYGAPTPAERLSAFTHAGAFLPSPGVPERHDAFAEASISGVPTISEFDLARWFDDRPVIAITGTDGKTSVTMLTVAMLEASGITSAGVGNTDTPFVEALDDGSYEVFVVEASSFRLGHSARFSPMASAWLNFSPDHLDVHTSIERYESAKAKIWSSVPDGGLVVGPVDDPTVLRHIPTNQQRVLVSSKTIDPTASDVTADAILGHVVDGMLVLGQDTLIAVDDLPRSFPHDLSNALTAAALAKHAGASVAGISNALRSFELPPHRIQRVAAIDGIEYFNDSKATVPHAVVTAVEAFDSVVLIAGGRNKGIDLSPMSASVDRVQAVVAIGDAASEIEAVFGELVPTVRAGDLSDAVDKARSFATSGDVVLLSPGCTSFDAYGSYGERGDHFIDIVSQLQTTEEA